MSQNVANRLPEAHGHSEPAPHHQINYFAIFGILVVLTIVTVAVAFIHIRSEAVKVLLALTIASIKAAFVALFFMHLKFEGKMIYIISGVPLMKVTMAGAVAMAKAPMPAVSVMVLSPMSPLASAAEKPGK